MRIKMDQWEVLRAVQLYLKHKYGFDYDLVDGLAAWPDIEYQERGQVLKKHKNGRAIKNEHGYPVVDHTKTTYKTKSTQWEDTDSMTLYLTWPKN